MRELSKRIETMQSRFATDFPQWANTVLGATALAMIRKRIRETGNSFDGGKYKPYSTKNLVLRNDMFLNQSQKKQAYKEAGWFSIKGESYAYLPGGYKRLRAITGLPVNHKDFLYSGNMWGSIKVLGTKQSSNNFITTVGPNNEDGMMKLEANEKREGKMILMVTQQEEADLNRILDEYITNIIRRVFNG